MFFFGYVTLLVVSCRVVCAPAACAWTFYFCRSCLSNLFSKCVIITAMCVSFLCVCVNRDHRRDQKLRKEKNRIRTTTTTFLFQGVFFSGRFLHSHTKPRNDASSGPWREIYRGLERASGRSRKRETRSKYSFFFLAILLTNLNY